MKKKNLKGLLLNKISISNLEAKEIIGGASTDYLACPRDTDFRPCQTSPACISVYYTCEPV